MLETLLEILSWELSAPEILLENGNISLDWNGASILIYPDGKVKWAYYSNQQAGTSLHEIKRLLETEKDAEP